MKHLFTGSLLAAALMASPLFSDGIRPVEEQTLSRTSENAASLERLVEVTKIQLQKQQNLLEKLGIFETARDFYLTDKQNRDAAFEMVKAAGDLLDGAQDANLQFLFRPELMEELTFYAKFLDKEKIARP